jgi:hypothetical protein
MSQMNHASRNLAGAPFLADWQPNIDRLKRQAEASSEAGKPNPYAVIEAECWLDLIDAEIAAHQSNAAENDVAATLEQLRHWKGQLQLALSLLRSHSKNVGFEDSSHRSRTGLSKVSAAQTAFAEDVKSLDRLAPGQGVLTSPKGACCPAGSLLYL